MQNEKKLKMLLSVLIPAGLIFSSNCRAGENDADILKTPDKSILNKVRLVDHIKPFEELLLKNRNLEKKGLARIVGKEYLDQRRSIYSMQAPIELDAAFIEKYLDTIDINSGAVKYSGKEISRETLISDIETFDSKFPLPGGLEVHIIPSFSFLKGMSVPMGGQTKVFLGLDEIQRLDEPQRQCFIYHELGHIIHYEAVPEVRKGAEDFFSGKGMTGGMYILLWVEGLPTYLARQINPNIPKDNILGAGEIIRQTKASYNRILPLLENKLDSNDISGFFYYPDNNHPEIPSNCGYYLGLLVVEEVAKNHSTEELIKLWGPDLQSEIHKAVARMRGK
jgi:hypothetical protein